MFVFTDDEGATPVKRRRVSSDEEHTVDSCISDLKTETREVLTPTSTSDNETRDSSIIDPGTEQDLPSPENQVNSLPIKPVKAGELVACIDFHESRVAEK